MNSPTNIVFTAAESVRLPFSVTKASDTIAAICNRNDTPCIIGEQQHGPNTNGYTIPTHKHVMGVILGKVIGNDFATAMENKALRQYYTLVCERLLSVGIHISCGHECWFITKLPRDNDFIVPPHAVYTISDMMKQRPNGIPQIPQQ